MLARGRVLGRRWFSSPFTRQANIDVLVPGLEVLEIIAYHIAHDHSVNMIESRGRVEGDGDNARARLKRVRFVMSRRGEWLADAEILNRLHKCQQEGMIISIIEKGDYKKKDLLDILVT